MYFLLKKLNKPIFNYKIDLTRYINVFELKRQKVYWKDKTNFCTQRECNPHTPWMPEWTWTVSVTDNFGNFRNRIILLFNKSACIIKLILFSPLENRLSIDFLETILQRSLANVILACQLINGNLAVQVTHQIVFNVFNNFSLPFGKWKSIPIWKIGDWEK